MSTFVPSLLGGLTPAEFLATHWQKKPLVVRQALPGFRGFLTPADLCRLAEKRDLVSRTVVTTDDHRPAKRFRLHHGPFKKLDAAKQPKNWSLLVQGIETVTEQGWPLLQHFDFIPSSRIDDLMVSWATTGGGVGPHSDLYDVFLLQGSGRRRWRIEEGGDLTVVEGADVRVLQTFKPQQDWVLEPGDLLYLPPDVAHEGTALDDDCMTWSIGFTQPTHAQLAGNFLSFLEMEDAPEGILTDRDLTLQAHPAELTDDSVARVSRVLSQTLGLSAGSSFDRERVASFVGRLSTGRPDVDHEAPKKPLSLAAFTARLREPGTLSLSKKTRLLYRDRRVFVNGAEVDLQDVSDDVMGLFRRLGNERRVALPEANEEFAAPVYALYAAGYVVVA
jgi:50S ribosomal protein L16 3-hydroxylase